MLADVSFVVFCVFVVTGSYCEIRRGTSTSNLMYKVLWRAH